MSYYGSANDSTQATTVPPRDVFAGGPASSQLVLLGFTAAVGGFLFGYDTCSMSAALLQIKRTRSSLSPCPGLAAYPLSIVEQEMITSFVVLGAFLSASAAGALNGRLGRRKVILIGATCFFVGELASAMAVTVTSMLISRVCLASA